MQKKRLFALFLAILVLTFTLIPLTASASSPPLKCKYNGNTLPNIDLLSRYTSPYYEYQYALIIQDSLFQSYLYTFESLPSLSSDSTYLVCGNNCKYAKNSSSNRWLLDSKRDSANVSLSLIVWSNFDILSSDGEILFASSVPEPVNLPIYNITNNGIYNEDGSVFGLFESGITVKPTKIHNVILARSGSLYYLCFSQEDFYVSDFGPLKVRDNKDFYVLSQQSGSSSFVSSQTVQSLSFDSVVAGNCVLYLENWYPSKFEFDYSYTINFLRIPQLPTAVQGIQMSGVMKEILMILPIGIASLVSYQALRKGLAILRQILSLA